ncbi:hypothetical protein AB1Y20_012488 [Prymnesium parvum]|uniref:Methenyltetrahydrofolate cyclohydrolase n=1 Tax=Prymnesium parvum TaxID=97485 RepID=A0AB34IIK5_PRYPA
MPRSTHLTEFGPINAARAQLTPQEQSASPMRPQGVEELSAEQRLALGGVAAELVTHTLQAVEEVVSSTVGCQGQDVPGVAFVMVGSHPAAVSYMKSTEAAARASRVSLTFHKWPEGVSSAELESCLVQLNSDKSVHGIILQLPLPMHLDEKQLLSHISDEKDIDGVKQSNLMRFMAHGESTICPCIGVGCDETLRALKLKPKSLGHAQVVMLGIPRLLRAPLQLALQASGWEVKFCGQDTCTARAELQLASVVLLGEPRPDLVAAQWVRDGCVILDLGLSSCAAPNPRAHGGSDGESEATAVTQRDVRWLCCSDGLSAITAALRMRNASHCSLTQQGFLDLIPPDLLDLHDDIRWPAEEPLPDSEEPVELFGASTLSTSPQGSLLAWIEGKLAGNPMSACEPLYPFDDSVHSTTRRGGTTDDTGMTVNGGTRES